MKISVKYFANMRDVMGKADDVVELTGGATIKDLWSLVSKNAMPENTLIAVNMEYTDVAHALSEGDEVAFFPPVTGG
ncbi:MAG: MoaD/ThiS family protein [Gammaproteobacteria bacterium]|nr:MoaD/ThiS family protein [Gammaproteobacteria bacterium]